MSDNLKDYYTQSITSDIASTDDYQRVTTRIKLGNLTREENPFSHCCAMILPYDTDTKKVLVVNHKKANSWIFPGGHIDSNELPVDTALREAEEEIGLRKKETVLVGPFGVQVLDINNPPQKCREHYDIFFAIATNPRAVSVNMAEFSGYDWLPVKIALERIEMEYYKDALDRFIKFVDW